MNSRTQVYIELFLRAEIVQCTVHGNAEKYMVGTMKWFYPAKTPNVLNGKCYSGENFAFQLSKAFGCRCERGFRLCFKEGESFLRVVKLFGRLTRIVLVKLLGGLTTWATSGWRRRNLSMTASILNSGKKRSIRVPSKAVTTKLVIEQKCSTQMKLFFRDRSLLSTVSRAGLASDQEFVLFSLALL